MKTGKTPCGLAYAARRRSGSSVGYCSLSIRCGSRDEKGYPEGITHFVEHTIFKGTGRKSAAVISGYLDKLGGELNAYTTKEEIVLHATVLKEDLDKAASLLFELATDSVFPQKEIDLERGVVIDEINSYKDSPYEDIYDSFEKMLFEGHPLSCMILGSKASVRKITREDLLSYVKSRFTPENMAFSIVADEAEEALEARAVALAGRFFGTEERGVENADARPRLEPPVNIFDKTVNKRNHQVNAVLGGLAPSLYEESERLATVLLCNILGGPASNSILNSVLRERHGWVYSVECSYTQYADTGIVAILLGCDKENLDKCWRAIEREIAKLCETPLSERRLNAARKQLLGQLAISSDSGENQCLSMGKSLLSYGCVMAGEQTRSKMAAITAEDIRKAASRIFAKDRLSKLVYL